jgi:prevent-host-death family protein
MRKEIDLQELQENLDELLDRVEEGEAFVITRHGKPIADLIPHQADAPTGQPQAR